MNYTCCGKKVTINFIDTDKAAANLAELKELLHDQCVLISIIRYGDKIIINPRNGFQRPPLDRIETELRKLEPTDFA